MNWKNSLTSKLNIRYPFIQAPMLGVTTPEMVASVSNKGALGSLPLGLTNSDEAASLIRSVKSQTSEMFSVNLFVHPKASIGKIPELKVLRSFYSRYNVEFPETIITQDSFTHYEELIDLIIDEKIPIVSFTFGIPGQSIVDRLRLNGCVLIGTATSTEEAKLIEEAGLDVIVAQGIEAGGHRGSFISKNLPQTGLISLLPQVIDAVSIPVVAAGGLMEGRSIAAAFITGAQGVQIGSAFLRSHESKASKIYKASVAASTDTSTVLTNAWTGKYARGIQNNFIIEMQTEEVLPYPMQINLTARLRQKGSEEGIEDIQYFLAGQSCRYARDKKSGDIISELIEGTQNVLSKAKEIFHSSDIH